MLKTKLLTVDIIKAGETRSLDEKAKKLADRMKDQLDTNDRYWPKTGEDREFDPIREFERRQEEYYYNFDPEREEEEYYRNFDPIREFERRQDEYYYNFVPERDYNDGW